MSYKASVGSISHGTLNPADLVGSFADELERISKDNPPDDPTHIMGMIAEADALATLQEAGYPVYEKLDSNVNGLLDDLRTALEEYAPPYCYFGNTDGDGSDFGFWPNMEAIAELPSIEMVEGEAIPDEDHKHVNDHGNVTVYAANGSVLLELV